MSALREEIAGPLGADGVARCRLLPGRVPLFGVPREQFDEAGANHASMPRRGWWPSGAADETQLGQGFRRLRLLHRGD